MQRLLPILLLIIVLVFGCQSIMDSHADARQAQATIEVAQVAQTQAWTNLIGILVLGVVILLIVFAVVALLILGIRFMQVRAETKPLQIYTRERAQLSTPTSTRRPLPTTDLALPDDISPEEIELIQRMLELEM